MILNPDSNGEDNAPLVEFNPCHGPDDGRFCSTGVTRVGITSYRAIDKPDHRPVGETVGPDFERFATALRAIPTISHVSVKRGTGAWKGAWEPTWIVGYRGNGEARRLLAETAKRYNQDSVLLMHRSARAKDPAVELQFSQKVSHAERDAINELLAAEKIGAWTWGRRGINTVLRSVAVPDWGGKADKHLLAMGRVSRAIDDLGYAHQRRVKHVETETWNRDDGDYDRAIGGE